MISSPTYSQQVAGPSVPSINRRDDVDATKFSVSSTQLLWAASQGHSQLAFDRIYLED